MLALVVLGLVACESASSFSFNKVTESWDEVIYHRNNYDSQLVILNKKKQNLNVQKKHLDEQVKNIDVQKDNLDTEIDKLNVQRDNLDREIDKLNMQKDVIDRETDIVYSRKDNFDRNIDDLYRQKDQLDNEVDKVDLEIENHNIDGDHDKYKVLRAVVKDNQYRITFDLPGFNKNEIFVKSGKRRLVVQALHDVLGEPKKNVQNIISLPDYVTENGSWSYKWDVLKIVFPIIQRTTHETTNANPDYDMKTTTPVDSQGNDIYVNDIYANADSKNEVGKVEATSQETSQEDRQNANTDGMSEKSEVYL